MLTLTGVSRPITVLAPSRPSCALASVKVAETFDVAAVLRDDGYG